MLYVTTFLPWCKKHNKVIFLVHFNRKCIACILDGINVIIMCYTNNNTAHKTQPNRPHCTADSSVTSTTTKSHVLTTIDRHTRNLQHFNYHTQTPSANTSRYLRYTPRSPTYSYSRRYDRTVSIVLGLQTMHIEPRFSSKVL